MTTWIQANLAALRRLSDGWILLHFTGKTLAGVGVGLLIGAARGADTTVSGGLILGLAILLGIISGQRILRERSAASGDHRHD